ncbi:EAL domain-containing protein [Methylophaga muralis]|uniref:Phytochrome-like protein cph2 n=1 Tax=Methylophaga muralis TaxID=291169 RepID=A0A1E3GSB6_9GAMM|nr:EAL domain-containing protein [Methylophaga muralis]ODN66939.1 Phytochrome-like protein cph2 [Methylophaga muralis]
MSEHKLLILDDDELTGETIRNVAEYAGMSVRVTTTATDFFDLLQQWKPTHIALDLIMPDMDGVEVLGALGEQQVSAKIIITSGVGHQVLQAAARSAAAHGLNIVGILPKPFNPKAFREMIDLPSPNLTDLIDGGQHQQSGLSLPAITAKDVAEAIKNRDITLAYQPKVSCASGVLTGFEALARWYHSDHGFIAPDVFIAIAEQNHLIDDLTLLVFEQALPWFNQFCKEQRHPPATAQASQLICSINISALSLPNLNLFNQVEALCGLHDVKLHSIMLELTETGAMDDPVASLDILTRLRMKGFQLSIDDFGTGFSSMLQLVRMPFSEVKVDKSFVMTAQQSRESRLVIQAIIELAHSLDMRVIAEGIEDYATLQFLQKLGCDKAQGYFIGKPVPANQINEWLQQRKLALEQQRIRALESLQIMDTLAEQRFDRITRLAKRMFDVPISLITLLDSKRQWFKSKVGVDIYETPREIAFCNYTIEQESSFIVNDAISDPRFSDNPLVIKAPFIRFYAGYPIRAPSGERLGTVCVIDQKPRYMSERDCRLLRELALMVEEEIATNQLLCEDHLTGLLNRRGFEFRANHVLHLCQTQDYEASLVYFDLDNFNQINDNLGHHAGDNALLQFSSLLNTTFRDSDLIGRIGADEFVVLMVNQKDTDQTTILQRLSNKVDIYNASTHADIHLHYSFGITTTKSLSDYDLQQLYTLADEAMYRNKRNGQHLNLAININSQPNH